MQKRTRRIKKTDRMTLGLAGFAKISAVEGIKFRPSSKQMFADFDRRGLTPAQRRRAIFEKHAKRP